MSAIVAAAAPRELSEQTRRWVVEATAYAASAGPDEQAVAFGERLGTRSRPATHRSGRRGAAPDARPSRLAGGRCASRRPFGACLQPARLRSGGRLRRQRPRAAARCVLRVGRSVLGPCRGRLRIRAVGRARARLLCGRDQIGVIPLHYARAGEELLVATALDALLLHPAVPDELDEEAIADFLVMGRGDFAPTTFRSIRRLPPAHTASWVDGDMRLRRYWLQDDWPPLVRFKTAEEYVNRFRELLEAAVADRMTDDRVSVQISGGMDSTSVAAFARRVVAGRDLPASAIRGTTMTLGADTGDEEGKVRRARRAVPRGRARDRGRVAVRTA